jgi:hypothetical protein
VTRTSTSRPARHKAASSHVTNSSNQPTQSNSTSAGSPPYAPTYTPPAAPPAATVAPAAAPTVVSGGS